MPASSLEYKLVTENARIKLRVINEKRRELKAIGIDISDDDWISAKKHLCRYKLEGLRREYKYYFEEDN